MHTFTRENYLKTDGKACQVSAKLDKCPDSQTKLLTHLVSTEPDETPVFQHKEADRVSTKPDSAPFLSDKRIQQVNTKPGSTLVVI